MIEEKNKILLLFKWKVKLIKFNNVSFLHLMDFLNILFLESA